jgi:HSP20 family molecular chaperone IbpA
MVSFYEKLSAKLQGEESAAGPKDPPANGAKSVSYNAAGLKTGAPPAAAAKGDPPGDPPAEAPAPEGTDPLMVDLFQSETRMVVFVQVPGVTPHDFEVTADEEANTLLVRATQKRPDLPVPPAAPQGAQPEKGRFSKQEIKWGQLYRKVYLPAPFDVGATDSYLVHGVLVIVLPIRRPGTGKKLSIRELNEEQKQ